MKEHIKVLFICHGNICRSPMAQSIMTHLVNQRHLSHRFQIASAATSREEIGRTPHHGTVNKLRQVGIPLVPHRAVQMTREDYDYYDYLIGMESYNLRNMHRITGGDDQGKMHLLLDFTNRKGQDIADPWYSGNFDETYRDVMQGCQGLLDYLLKEGQ